MGIRVAISHKTKYIYDKAINVSPQVIKLRPAAHSRTSISSYGLKITPKEHFVNWQQDPFGNYLARVVFPEKVDHFGIEVELIADMQVINPFDFFMEEHAEHFPFKYSDQLRKDLAPYLKVTEDGPELRSFVSEFFPKKLQVLSVQEKKNLKRINAKKNKKALREEKLKLEEKQQAIFDDLRKEEYRTVDHLVAVNSALNQKIQYSIRLEPGVQSCETTLGKAFGSCRDSAWVLVQAFRKMGMAARFVSGYLIQLTADEKSLDGPSGPEEDFTDLHAWCEVYVPGAGWIGLDPTSGLFAGEGHIPLACTPEPSTAAPVTGLTDPCEVEFEYDNSVQRIHEDPRVTKPYTDQVWQNILATGNKVDEDLMANDVRLTMGGEPTFVSIDDMEAPEWNTVADGFHKRDRANVLARRLTETFGKGGFLQHGQGKQYPGEAFPRWQMACMWRKDGKKLWKDPEYLANHAKDYGHTIDDAKNFMNSFSSYLNVDVSCALPTYEDIFYFLWEEGQIPVGVDPLKVNLKDSHERRKLAELLEKGMDTPTSYVLPLRYDWFNDSWQTCQWQFNRKDIFLIPGNSPAGLRLPLKSLNNELLIEPNSIPNVMEDLGDLENYHKKVQRRQRSGESFNTHPQYVFQTAVSVEPREGRLHVFLPPMTHLEYFLDLLACVEKAATETNLPVIVEGYTPPKDYRLQKILVTPDPGVIEVNIHPSTSWQELVNNTEVLYEEARLSRLGTEKFMVDGRHTGTGGGNHITIGGIRPADSPLLRRPNLLQSLVTYWQHHPGLSYLFSSPFIGPTSQAPRVDEGRDEMLYEMELAFTQVPDVENPPYWVTDRIFRNLLVDITGNTHRAEFCIDKLYSPDSLSGRQGILEFRGFDMPPHKYMSLVQSLLIRSLVSKFWKTPYKKPLVRWGTELHDKYLLEHYVRKDFEEIIADLNQEGYNFEMSWFDPFFEFRFPVLGTKMIDDIELELRWAIEPWHVLGEEMSSTGTSRFVDSSIERVQLKVKGLIGNRYVVTCNGKRLPMTKTGVKGEFVAGVRYKAWAPPSSLHPTLGVDTPLTFDVIDTWNHRSIGGFTYHVSHPGGRSYDTFPINAFEAESRRISRFGASAKDITEIKKQNQKNDPSVGIKKATPEHLEANRTIRDFSNDSQVYIPPMEYSEEYPHCLDLRK